MPQKGVGDRLRRRADVDEERGPIRDQVGDGLADRRLFVGGRRAAGVVTDILDARGEDRPAVDARQQPLFAEVR